MRTTEIPSAPADSLQPALAQGLEALDIDRSPALMQGLLRYVLLLVRWNSAYNLTAVRAPEEMLPRHLFDSLAVARWLASSALADLGSGAGLPGIPLALLDRTRPVTLVESNGKKARFLRTAVRELELPRVSVHEARTEATGAVPHPLVIARALAPIDRLVRMAEPWLSAEGRLLAMKGPGVETELATLPPSMIVHAQHRYRVPGLDAERHLVVLKRAPTAH